MSDKLEDSVKNRVPLLGRLLTRVAFEPKKLDYVALAVLGAIPMIVACVVGIGYFEDESIHGFNERPNWFLFPLFLPAALYVFRWIMGSLFLRGKHALPEADAERYRPILTQATKLLDDSKTLGIALILTVALTAIDKWEVLVHRYMANLTRIPEGVQIDWGWLYLEPHAYASLPEVLLVDGLATMNQMLLFVFALTVMVALYRYNTAYLRAIYQRSRADSNGPHYELRFDADDKRFGLSGLYPVFNAQLWFISIAGAFMLISRYANTSDVWEKFVGVKEGAIEPSALSGLFTDVGQWILMLMWLYCFWVAMLPARVKLLPLGTRGARRSAEHYLPEFLREESEQLERPVDELAASFRANSFWPNGEPSAKHYLFFGSLIGCFMVFPIRLDAAGVTLSGLGGLLAVSMTVTLATLAYHRYRLRLVDTRLAGPPFPLLSKFIGS